VVQVVAQAQVVVQAHQVAQAVRVHRVVQEQVVRQEHQEQQVEQVVLREHGFSILQMEQIVVNLTASLNTLQLMEI
jgi:hypothetical protein